MCLCQSYFSLLLFAISSEAYLSCFEKLLFVTFLSILVPSGS